MILNLLVAMDAAHFFFYLFRNLCFTIMPQYRYKHEPLVISSLIKSQNIAHHEQTRELV